MSELPETIVSGFCSQFERENNKIVMKFSENFCVTEGGEGTDKIVRFFEILPSHDFAGIFSAFVGGYWT